MELSKKIKVWITKYALTSGMKTDENAETCGEYPTMISCKEGKGGYYLVHYHKPDWHETEEAANAQVRKMIDAKMKSIQKTLKRLETLKEKYK